MRIASRTLERVGDGTAHVARGQPWDAPHPFTATSPTIHRYNRVRQLLQRERARRAGAAPEPIRDCTYVASGYFGTCVCPGTYYRCAVSKDGLNNKRCEVTHFANQSYAECAASCK